MIALLSALPVLGAGGADIPNWVSLPTNVGLAGAVAWAVWTGKLRRAVDCEAEKAALIQAHAHEIAAATALCDEKLRTAEALRAAAETRLAAVLVDRDRWREAHGASIEALRASEAAGAAAMDSNGVVAKLLTALESALDRGGKA